MAALIKSVGVSVGALATLFTGVTLGFAQLPGSLPNHGPIRLPGTLSRAFSAPVPSRPVAHRPASTSTEDIAGYLFASRVALPPPPPPAPEPAPVEEATATAAAPAASTPAYTPIQAPAANAAPAPAPAPAIVIGSAQQSYINQDRAAAGLAPLTWSSCLAGIAAGQSQAMAARGQIYHGNGVNQDFGCGLGSRQTGENVGYWTGGINDGQLNTMFMNSPEHRANIMGPYHYVGTAWVVGPNGTGYITVEFA